MDVLFGSSSEKKDGQGMEVLRKARYNSRAEGSDHV